MLDLHRPNRSASTAYRFMPSCGEVAAAGALKVGSQRIPAFGRKSIAKVLLHQDLHTGAPNRLNGHSPTDFAKSIARQEVGQPSETGIRAFFHKVFRGVERHRLARGRRAVNGVARPSGDGEGAAYRAAPSRGAPRGRDRARPLGESVSVVAFELEFYIEPFESAEVTDLSLGK